MKEKGGAALLSAVKLITFFGWFMGAKDVSDRDLIGFSSRRSLRINKSNESKKGVGVHEDRKHGVMIQADGIYLQFIILRMIRVSTVCTWVYVSEAEEKPCMMPSSYSAEKHGAHGSGS